MCRASVERRNSGAPSKSLAQPTQVVSGEPSAPSVASAAVRDRRSSRLASAIAAVRDSSAPAAIMFVVPASSVAGSPPPAGRDKARRAGAVKSADRIARSVVEHSGKRAILNGDGRKGARRKALRRPSGPREGHTSAAKGLIVPPRLVGSGGGQPTRSKRMEAGDSCRQSPWSTTTATFSPPSRCRWRRKAIASRPTPTARARSTG